MSVSPGRAADLPYPGDNGYGEGEGCPTCPCCHVDTCIDYGCHMAPARKVRLNARVARRNAEVQR